jgi:hypothetical protein
MHRLSAMRSAREARSLSQFAGGVLATQDECRYDNDTFLVFVAARGRSV